MTETTSTETTEVTVSASVRGVDEVEPWNKPLWKMVAYIVAFFPTYRDSREGRKTRKNIRIMLLVVGGALMLIGGSADQWPVFWILLGIGIASLNFVFPVEDMKMRSWRTTLKKKQKPRQKHRWDDGRVEFDGRYVALYAGDERVQRVRVDRDKHHVELKHYDDRPCLGILPMSKKMKESIWLCSTEAVSADIETSGPLNADNLRRPARVDPNDWERLWEALRQTD